MAYGNSNRFIYAQMPGGGFVPRPEGIIPVTQQPEAAMPAQPAAPAPAPPPKESETHLLKRPRRLPFIAIAIVVILAVVAVTYIKVIPHQMATSSTTSIISTISQKSISVCESISSPGNYTFAGNVSTSIASGACISINSSNVNLNCKGYYLYGHGPF